MSEFLIAVNDRRAGPFVAGAGQTVFPYDFPLFDAADIAVYAQATGAATATLLASSAYSVTGIGDAVGGTIVLGTGATAGTIYSIRGARNPRRTTDFSEAGDFRAETLNRELDLLAQTAQEQAAGLGRALRLAETDTASTTVLPTAAARANKVLGFDELGNLVVTNVGTLALADGDVTTDKIADLAVTGDKLAAGAVNARNESDDPWSSVASAATVDLGGINSRNALITGTTGITSFGNTGTEGRTIRVRFAAALIMTNSATLICPGGANITTAAGDTAVLVKEAAASTWRIVEYQRANGQAVAAPTSGPTRGTLAATTSGTAIDFTGLPATISRIHILFNQVSTNGSSPLMIQIGPTGGIETTNYSVFEERLSGTSIVGSIVTGGFRFYDNVASVFYSGAITLHLVDPANNVWVGGGRIIDGSANRHDSWGRKALAGPLARVRLTTPSGTDLFDSGSFNIIYD
jgi:hypothetical protein